MSEARIKQFEDAMREQGYTVFPPASESQPGDRTFYRCGAVKFPVGVTVGSGPAGGGWSPLEAMEYLAAQVLPELPRTAP
jgi:hypothetical protein